MALILLRKEAFTGNQTNATEENISCVLAWPRVSRVKVGISMGTDGVGPRRGSLEQRGIGILVPGGMGGKGGLAMGAETVHEPG